MKIQSIVVMIMSAFIIAFSREMTQTVRGTVVDIDNKKQLKGVTVEIAGTDSTISTLTDESGRFRFAHIPVGRIALKISFSGYDEKLIPDLTVNSGKETVLDLTMQEAVMKLDKVVISAHRKKGEAHNDMALVSTRSISASETNRYAGGYDDPSIILKDFAGVKSTANGNNDIIVRGNAPKYIQWRLDGVEIASPVHQADQNSSIAGFCVLNNKLLATSDFYTGAFTPEFGDVLSAIYDVKLRPGNNEKLETSIGIGIMGTDLMLEGPIAKDYGGSFLINYRYSTVGLLQRLKLVNIPGVTTTFQDGTMKLVLPSSNAGTFSLFVLGSLDSLYVKNVTPEIWQTPGTDFMQPKLTQNFDKGNYFADVGLNHLLTIDDHSILNTTLAYSRMGMKDIVLESENTNSPDVSGNTIFDTLEAKQNYKSNISTSDYKGTVNYSNRFNAHHKVEIGAEYSYVNEYNDQSQLASGSSLDRLSLVNYKGTIQTLQTYLAWKYNVNEFLTLVSGIHNFNVFLNNKSTVEPRIALNLTLDNEDKISFGYGKHSKMETLHNYYAQVRQSDGSIIEPNKNLGLLKADHFVLGYEKSFARNWHAKTELYYQRLYDLPVENNDSSIYSTINEGSDYHYVPLVNKGSGKNYGVEATLERFYNNHYYLMLNGTVYDSKYKALDGIERNTAYNSNYLVNLLGGKEFILGSRHNHTLTINGKVFYSGGQRYIPLLKDAQGNLAVDPVNNRFWDFSKAYENTFDDIFSLDLTLSYKLNLHRSAHELFLSITNLTGNNAKLSEYYDSSKPGKINYIRQMPTLPNLMYRVYF